MKKRWFVLAAVFAAAAAVTLPASAVTPSAVYDNIPSPQPGNVPSLGFEATSTSEFGGLVQLAGTQRQDPSVTVLMSSWGCQSGTWNGKDCSTAPGASFTEPITLNVYNAGPDGSIGSLITSATQTFSIPFRPSADNVNCTGGTWYSAADDACYNGLATPISFDLPSVTLPDEVILSVAYNTSHYGSAPYGTATDCYASSAGCGYDALNVGLAPGPTTGTAPLPADAYLDSTWEGAYCDGGASGTGSFRLDAGCWTGYQPAFRVAALTVNPPANKNACKDGGWAALTRADASTFANQGDCIQYVNTGK